MADVPVKTGIQSSGAEPSLHRVMGPWLLLLFIVGDILGTGFMRSQARLRSKRGGVVWLPFVIAFLAEPVSFQAGVLGAADSAFRSKVLKQFFFQHPTRLNKQASIDRLV